MFIKFDQEHVNIKDDFRRIRLKLSIKHSQ